MLAWLVEVGLFWASVALELHHMSGSSTQWLWLDRKGGGSRYILGIL